MAERQRITDPHAAPVIRVDTHLPTLGPAMLTASALRAVEPARWSEWRPTWAGDGRQKAAPEQDRFSPDATPVAGAPEEPAGRPPTAASVLVPLVAREHALGVLLTRRTEHLTSHAGQISFPGGRAEPTDRDAVDTALREAEEEIGLGRRHVEVLGTMSEYTTVTGFRVTPVVALVHPPLDLRLDGFEVAEAFEVPLPFLMNPANHRHHLFQGPRGTRGFLSMPWQTSSADASPREFFIWGATAAMLRNLYEFLAQSAGYHRGE